MSFWMKLFGAKQPSKVTSPEVAPSAASIRGAHPQPAISQTKMDSARRALAAKRDEAVRVGLKATKGNKALQALFKDKAWMDATFRREELVAAAAQGRRDDVEVLLIDGAAPDAIGDSKNGPLHVSAYHGHLAVVEVLLRYGADKNLRGDQGVAPLHLAAQEGRLNIVECLLGSGAEIDARDSASMTPLHYATQLGRASVAELLLANGADANAKSDNGLTPLHKAVETNRKDLATLLLLKNADVNAKNKLGDTPLHYAAFTGNTNIAELLLASKAEVGAKDNSGQTPFHYASANGHQKLAELLRQHGGAEGKVSIEPTLRCVGCGGVYRIGHDALIATLESGLGLARSTITVSDGGTPDREDLVSPLESVESVESSKEKARQNWTAIQDSLARGQRRTWRCRVCDRVNTYP